MKEKYFVIDNFMVDYVKIIILSTLVEFEGLTSSVDGVVVSREKTEVAIKVRRHT